MSFVQFLDYAPPHLSYSSVDSYRSCGEKFFLQKVLRKEQRPGLAGLAGNVIHAVTEEIDRHIFDHGFPSESSEVDPPF